MRANTTPTIELLRIPCGYIDGTQQSSVIIHTSDYAIYFVLEEHIYK